MVGLRFEAKFALLFFIMQNYDDGVFFLNFLYFYKVLNVKMSIKRL
jgi:hypothetical protein